MTTIIDTEDCEAMRDRLEALLPIVSKISADDLNLLVLLVGLRDDCVCVTEIASNHPDSFDGNSYVPELDRSLEMMEDVVCKVEMKRVAEQFTAAGIDVRKLFKVQREVKFTMTIAGTSYK